jgi:hypothetical protein
MEAILLSLWMTAGEPLTSTARQAGRMSNRPPVAYAGAQRVAMVGEAVAFDGQGASPAQEIVEYKWDFESDGVVDFVSAKTSRTVHTFTNPGEYQCLLQVKDTSGQSAQSVRRIVVIPEGAERKADEKALQAAPGIRANAADGITHRYAILFNGGSEERYWTDMTLCYAMLSERYDFSPADIYLLNYDGKNPTGDNPNGMIDRAATLENLQTVISELRTDVDSDDEVFICITDHGRGYSGPLSQGGRGVGEFLGRAIGVPGVDTPIFC